MCYHVIISLGLHYQLPLAMCIAMQMFSVVVYVILLMWQNVSPINSLRTILVQAHLQIVGQSWSQSLFLGQSLNSLKEVLWSFVNIYHRRGLDCLC